MTNTPSSDQRLDRVERILDTLATNLINERDARLELKEDLEILYQTVQLAVDRTDSTINALALDQKATQSNVNDLTQLMVQFAKNAEADRAEIRQIWEYLLSQKSNGHS
jgi:hypothetical protein